MNDDTPLYAVGDIHGHVDLLDRALALIEADGGRAAEVVFLGDLADRGPDTRGVIQRLIDGIDAGRPWQVLKGNHDRMFSRFVRSAEIHDARILSGVDWLHPRLGGPETLASYGVASSAQTPPERIAKAARAAVPAAHLDFLDSRPLWVERGALLFVHAGIAPGVALEAQTEDDLIWIRDPFLNHARPHPWLVVHGHSAVELPEHRGNRVNLDGGAGYGRMLHPAVFEGRDAWLLTEAGRKPLRPYTSRPTR